MKLEFKQAHTDQDCSLLFKWINDPITRMNSFHTEMIPYDEHCKWFSTKMNNPGSIIYICVDVDIKLEVGQIRVEFDNDIGEINYCVEPQSRGKGFGTEILKLLPNQLIKDGFVFSKLIGKVKHNNIASEKVFLKAGYQVEISSEWKEFTWLNQH